jgi:predicted PurR-regulated permease PerM
MGNNLQLQPLTILFALMVGGQIGSIAGLYLSVPTVAVLRIVWLGCFANRSPSIAISNEPLAQIQA